jgi:hypothetical protein
MSSPTEPNADPAAGNPQQPPASSEPAVEPVTVEPSGSEPADDVPLGPAGEKALAEWKARAKEAERQSKEQAARIQAFEDRDKTEAEKLAERATKAEERAAAATRLATASKVEALAAGRFHDPQDAVDALQGAEFLTEDGGIDRDAITAALDSLLERKPHWAATAPGPRVPAPDPSQGARPGGTPTLGQRINEAVSGGDTKLALSLKTQQLREISQQTK